MVEFRKGQKSRLSDLTTGTDLYVGVRLDAPGLGFDISCFGLDEADRLSDDRYFVFFNQPKSPEESIQLLGAQAGDTESFRVTLDRVPPRIAKLAFTATIDGDGTMSQVASGYVRIVAGGQEVARYSFTGTEFSTERAVMIADLYRKDVWRFSAVGQGFDGGLRALLENFGGEVADEDPAPEPQAPSPAGAPPAFGPPGGGAPQQAPAFGPPGGGAPAPAAPAFGGPPGAPQPPPGIHQPAAAQPQPSFPGGPPPAGPPGTPPHGAPGGYPPPSGPPMHGGPPGPGGYPPPPGPHGTPPHGAPGGFPPPPGPGGYPPPPGPGGYPPPGPHGTPPHGAPGGYPPPPGPPMHGGPPGPSQPTLVMPQPGAPGMGQPMGGPPMGGPPMGGPPMGGPGMPPAMAVAAEDAPFQYGIEQYREVQTQGRWVQQNPKMVRVDVSGGKVIARQGVMVAYQGDVKFKFQGQSLRNRFDNRQTGQSLELMRCEGNGEVFLAEDAANLHLVDLQGNQLCVNAANVLAYDEGLTIEPKRIEGHGIPGGGLFVQTFSGQGTVVLKTQGIPLVLPVQGPTFADSNAIVAWTDGNGMQVSTTTQMRLRRTAFPGHSGETVNLQFRCPPGNHFIVVQPYEV